MTQHEQLLAALPEIKYALSSPRSRTYLTILLLEHATPLLAAVERGERWKKLAKNLIRLGKSMDNKSAFIELVASEEGISQQEACAKMNAALKIKHNQLSKEDAQP